MSFTVRLVDLFHGQSFVSVTDDVGRAGPLGVCMKSHNPSVLKIFKRKQRQVLWGEACCLAFSVLRN